MVVTEEINSTGSVAETYTIDMPTEEKRFIRIIKKIQQQRNRAGYQNVLSLARRENKELNMEVCKNVIDILVERKIVVNIGKDPKCESFKVVEEDSTLEDTPSSNNEDTLKTSDELVNFIEGYYENILDDKFYNILSSMIKKECQIAVNNCIKKDYVNDAIKDDIINNDINCTKNSIEISHLQDFIASQKREIEFLRNEVLSKDKIIQMLINDKLKTDQSNKPIVQKQSPSCNTNEHIEKIYLDEHKDGKRKKKRSVVILGDSMLKDIEPNKVKKGVGDNEKVFVKHFSGATTNHMKSYVVPSKEFNNDLVILHCGTNDLRSNKSPLEIATEISILALDLKNENNNVMISGLVPRRDKFNDKGIEVNKYLLSLCAENDFNFIDNSNINIETHLNTSGLHLNFRGTYILGGNFVNAIKL